VANIVLSPQAEAKKTGTLRLPLRFNPESGLHVRDNRVAKLSKFQQISCLQTFNDQVSGFKLFHTMQYYFINAHHGALIFRLKNHK